MQKQADSQIKQSKDQFVSRIFIVKKANGGNRLIIDLSYLNSFISKVHFRMEGVRDLKAMLQTNDFMASIDLADAFYSIPLHPISRNYVTFELNNQRYAFNVLSFGLSSSPRIFRKIFAATNHSS